MSIAPPTCSRLGWHCGIAVCMTMLTLAACTPSDPLEKARKLQERGAFAATIEPLRALLDEDPSSAEANYLYGRALLRTGEPSQAVWPLRRASQSPEFAVDAGLALTRATLRSRFKLEAIRAANDVLAIEPDNVAALELRAEAHVGAAEFELALKDVDRVLELAPENSSVRIHQAISLITLERIDEAAASLAAAKEAVDGAEGEVSNQTRAKLCVVSALFTSERGEQEKAELAYAQCLEAHPTDLLVVSESVSFYDSVGKREKATETLEAALAAEPSSEFRRMLAERMLSLGKIEETEQLLIENADELGSAGAWFELGSFYYDREQIDQALDAFERALEAPGNPPPMFRFAYADTLIVANRPDDARRAAAALDDESLKSLIEGRARLSEGNPRGALAEFDRGIKLWPNNPGARTLAGQAAEQIGEFLKAESNYREAIRAEGHEPVNSEASLRLSRLLEAMGAYNQALEHIGRYSRSNPTDPDGYITSVRLANEVGRKGIVPEGLRRLSRLPGQSGVAIALRLELTKTNRGAEAMLAQAEKSKVDLTLELNAPVLGVVVEALSGLGRHEEALAHMQPALERHPKSAALHAMHGKALFAASAPESRVREAFSQALESAPDDFEALNGLAQVEAASGNLEAAIELFDRADATSPATPDAAIAAFVARRPALSLTEIDARLVDLLRRYPHDPRLASMLAIELSSDQTQIARALALASRSRKFSRPPFDEPLAAFEAIAATKIEPQATQAIDAIARLEPTAEPKPEPTAEPVAKSTTNG